MGKTYRSFFGTGKCYRNCSGWKNAKKNNCRPKAIPPDGWGVEVPASRMMDRPRRVIKDMKEQGYPLYETVRRIKKKFRFTHRQALEICNYQYNPQFLYDIFLEPESTVPEGQLFIWKKKRIKNKRY